MSYLAISTKIGSEMITKNTASNSSLAICSSIISAKDHKTNWQTMKKYELRKNAESHWSKVWRWSEDYVFKKPPGRASAANCHPFLSWVVGVFFSSPGRMKASKFQHNGGVVVHVKDGKICLTKEVCKLTRDKDGMSLLTVAEKTDVSSCLAKHTQKNDIFFFLNFA